MLLLFTLCQRRLWFDELWRVFVCVFYSKIFGAAKQRVKKWLCLEPFGPQFSEVAADQVRGRISQLATLRVFARFVGKAVGLFKSRHH